MQYENLEPLDELDFAIDDEPTVKQEHHEQTVMFALPRLTPTQRRRVLDRMRGLSDSDIARSEGVSRQSISETFAAPAVRAKLGTILGRAVALRDGHGLNSDPIARLLKRLFFLAENGSKPVILSHEGSQRVELVADHRLQADVALRLLAFVDPPTEMEREQTVETRETVRVKQRQP